MKLFKQRSRWCYFHDFTTETLVVVISRCENLIRLGLETFLYLFVICGLNVNATSTYRKKLYRDLMSSRSVQWRGNKGDLLLFTAFLLVEVGHKFSALLEVGIQTAVEPWMLLSWLMGSSSESCWLACSWHQNNF
jgi:hypothetical protein